MSGVSERGENNVRFNCGETVEYKNERLLHWHPFFAVLPVRVANHDCRMFEWIERKGKLVPAYLDYGGHDSVCVGEQWKWEYRAKP